MENDPGVVGRDDTIGSIIGKPGLIIGIGEPIGVSGALGAIPLALGCGTGV